MTNRKQIVTLILPLIIFVGVCVFLWVGLHRNPREIPSPLLNKSAPAFSAPSLQFPEHLLTEQDLLGHVTILNVFASWCVACETEHSVLLEGRNAFTGHANNWVKL